MRRHRTQTIRHTSKRFALAVLLLCFASASQASTPRTLQTAVYAADYEGWHIKMTRRLIDRGNGSFRLEAKASNFLGSITEREDFLWDADMGIQPISYHYTQKIFGIKKERKVRFDWKNGTAFSDNKGKKREISLSKGVLGPMTYQLKLQMDLIAQSNTEVGIINHSFNYDFIGRGKLKEFRFKVLGVENIRQEKTRVTGALKMKRDNEGGKRQTTIWFDPANHYSIASIVQTKDDDRQSLFIVSNKFYPPFDESPLSVISGS
ncbi:MAG: DUF3108 domain-containing protein [Agarilytica sp.]